jgi:MYXO-CTERM domain-containing protein
LALGLKWAQKTDRPSQGYIAMTFKSLVAAATLVASGLASAAAPVPVTFGGFVQPGAFTVSLGTVVVGSGTNAGVYGGVGSSPITVTASSPFGPQTMTFAALTLTNVALGASTDTNLADGFSFTGLSAGSYALSLSGTSITGGAYSGYYDVVTTSAVPEAGSTALALAGLGVAGLLLRRRTSV